MTQEISSSEPEKVYEHLIYKQSLLLIDGPQILHLPNSSRILKVDVQGTDICVWYEFYNYPGNQEKTWPWTFQVIGTGHAFMKGTMHHVATVMMPPFVWHVYQH